MSLHYILDGYNIIKQSEKLSKRKLESEREALAALLAGQRPHGSSNNRITVVYDGVAGMFSEGGRPAGIKVVFSQDGSADDTIKALVDRARHKNDIVVVSDDRSLRYYVRALGARVLGVKAFLGQGRAAPPGRTGTGGMSAGKHIPKTLESKITREMHEVWVKKAKKKT